MGKQSKRFNRLGALAEPSARCPSESHKWGVVQPEQAAEQPHSAQPHLLEGGAPLGCEYAQEMVKSNEKHTNISLASSFSFHSSHLTPQELLGARLASRTLLFFLFTDASPSCNHPWFLNPLSYSVWCNRRNCELRGCWECCSFPIGKQLSFLFRNQTYLGSL